MKHKSQIYRYFLTAVMIMTIFSCRNSLVNAEEIYPAPVMAESCVSEYRMSVPVTLQETEPSETTESQSKKAFINTVLPVLAILVISFLGARALAKKK